MCDSANGIALDKPGDLPLEFKHFSTCGGRVWEIDMIRKPLIAVAVAAARDGALAVDTIMASAVVVTERHLAAPVTIFKASALSL